MASCLSSNEPQETVHHELLLLVPQLRLVCLIRVTQVCIRTHAGNYKTHVGCLVLLITATRGHLSDFLHGAAVAGELGNSFDGWHTPAIDTGIQTKVVGSCLLSMCAAISLSCSAISSTSPANYPALF